MVGASMIKVLLLVSTLNIGDVSSAEEILRLFRADISKTTMTFATVDASFAAEDLMRSFTSKVRNNKDCFLVVAVGNKGYEALDLLAKHKLLQDNMYIYWVGDTMPPDLNDKVAQLHIDHITIPQHLTNQKLYEKLQQESEFVSTTFGVPSKTVSLEMLEAYYRNWNKGRFANRPALDKKYIIVMLPGDTQDSGGQIRLFSKASAKSLFEKVVALHKNNPDFEILVHSGPDTGKFAEDAKDIACNHEYSKGQVVPLDEVSKYFIALLDESKIKYKFFNFGFELKYNIKKAVSVLDPLLFVAASTDSYYIVPAESVAQISHLTLYLDPAKLIAFESDSMNDEHMKMLDLAWSNGYLSKFNDKNEIISPDRGALRNNRDVVEVVQNIITGVRQKCTGTRGCEE